MSSASINCLAPAFQATDGSIPFYERMGFVRVGAVIATKIEAHNEVDCVSAVPRHKGKDAARGAAVAGQESTKKRKAINAPSKSSWVCSPCYELKTSSSTEETLAMIASR